MPNASKKQKDPGLEDELRKMILGNVRVQDDQPRASSSPGKRNGHQSPRGQGFRSPRSPALNDQTQFQSDKKTDAIVSGDRFGRNSTGSPGQNRSYRGQDFSARKDAHQDRNSPRPQRSSAALGHAPRDQEGFTRPPPRSRQLYQPNPRPSPRPPPPAIFIAQCEYLDRLVSAEVSQSQMSYEEYTAKETYRDTLERGFRQTLQHLGLPGPDILGLRGFGSFSSGFATANSDVDLAVVLRPLPGQTAEQFAMLTKEMPRVLEKALLDAGFGARLLDRTRVPIIKTCQAPTPELLTALREERTKWDDLPEEEKYTQKSRKDKSEANEAEEVAGDTEWQWKAAQTDQPLKGTAESAPVSAHTEVSAPGEIYSPGSGGPSEQASAPTPVLMSAKEEHDDAKTRQKPKQKPWLRERPQGPLDFPKEGVGIQADINFSNALALHNTEMLRCYSLCDPRVQPMVLFIKAWAKRRKVNSSYNGTLSSYGYVMMVLHFLINVVQPPVLPNLQLAQASLPQGTWNGPLQWQPLPDQGVTCDGYAVNFWREPDMVKQLSSRGLMTENQEPLGVLLRNFFHYFAHQGNMVIGGGFQWTSEVISIRSQGGLLSKEEKGWTGAKTTTTDNREVRHRYLFALEDPFELDHNVARTVTHHGIVAIRDEFRRAWRILMDVGNGREPQQGHLFDQVTEAQPETEGEEVQQPAPAPQPHVSVNAENNAAFLQPLTR